MTSQKSDIPDPNILDIRKKKSAASKSVREVRRRLEVDYKGFAFELELLAHFARNQTNAGLLLPLFVVLVGVMSVSTHGWFFCSIWLLVTSLCYVLLRMLSRRYLSEKPNKSEFSKWKNAFLYPQLAISACWAIYAYFDCMSCDGNQYPIIQFSALLIFQALTVMLNYALSRSVLIVAAPASFVLAGRFIMTQDKYLMIMGVITLISLIVFFMIADRFKRSQIKMFGHATEKEILIAELETAKSFSESARKRAEEANLAKSRFLATMSHELRTPLNAILGFSEIMRDEILGPMGNDSYKDYAKDINSSGAHLLKLINEILDLSRIEAGKHEMQEENLKLVNVVDEAVHMVNVKAKQKNISLNSSYEDDLPAVLGDERSLRQITLNLLSNAIKFTPMNGEITIKVGWTQRGGQYISVKDSGPGIPEEEIPVVLSSFGQGAIAIKHAEQGTGLGLSIVQALVHMHNGRFELKSKLRDGTEAIVYLPPSRVVANQKPIARVDDLSKGELVAS